MAKFKNKQVCPSYLINVYSTLTKQKNQRSLSGTKSNEVGEA